MEKEFTDVLVIGADPSGTVAASIIWQAGKLARFIDMRDSNSH